MAPQALLLARHDLRRDVLVLASEDEQQAQPAEPFGCPREIEVGRHLAGPQDQAIDARGAPRRPAARRRRPLRVSRSEEHTSELQSPCNLVCRLLLEKKKNTRYPPHSLP